jgi:hypothetical protein
MESSTGSRRGVDSNGRIAGDPRGLGIAGRRRRYALVPITLQAVKFGYSLLADLSTIGVAYLGAGVVTSRSYMREAPDIVRRYLRAYVEALHRFKTDKNFSIRVIGKYSRIADADIEALEEPINTMR